MKTKLRTQKLQCLLHDKSKHNPIIHKTNKNMRIYTTYKSVYAKHIFSYHEEMWMWIMVLKMDKGGLHGLTKY